MNLKRKFFRAIGVGVVGVLLLGTLLDLRASSPDDAWIRESLAKEILFDQDAFVASITMVDAPVESSWPAFKIEINENPVRETVAYLARFPNADYAQNVLRWIRTGVPTGGEAIQGTGLGDVVVLFGTLPGNLRAGGLVVRRGAVIYKIKKMTGMPREEFFAIGRDLGGRIDAALAAMVPTTSPNVPGPQIPATDQRSETSKTPTARPMSPVGVMRTSENSPSEGNWGLIVIILALLGVGAFAVMRRNRSRR